MRLGILEPVDDCDPSGQGERERGMHVSRAQSGDPSERASSAPHARVASRKTVGEGRTARTSGEPAHCERSGHRSAEAELRDSALGEGAEQHRYETMK